MVDYLPSKQGMRVQISLFAIRGHNSVGRVCVLHAQSHRFKPACFQKDYKAL